MNAEPKTAYYDQLPARFAETQWTEIVRPSSQGDPEALNLLACAYWYPLYWHARRQGSDEQDAQDHVQAFFVKLLGSEAIRSADPRRGKFRSYLLGMFRNFLTDRWRKGSHRPLHEAFDEIVEEQGEVAVPAHHDSREADFYRDWSVTLVNLALQRLEEEQHALGRGELFAHLKHHLDSGKDLEALSEKTGVPVNTLKSDLRRLRKVHLSRLLKEEVRRTLQDPTSEEVAEELRFIRRFGARLD